MQKQLSEVLQVLHWLNCQMSVWFLERQYLSNGLRVEAAFALGWVNLFCLEGGLHGNHKNSAFPTSSTYSRPNFLLCCWKKNLVYSVHQYNVCVCVCILFSSFKTMLHKLWFYTCKDRRNYMERAWRRWNVWSCAQSKVLSNADTYILTVVLACEILRGTDIFKRRNKTKQTDAIWMSLKFRRGNPLPHTSSSPIPPQKTNPNLFVVSEKLRFM